MTDTLDVYLMQLEDRRLSHLQQEQCRSVGFLAVSGDRAIHCGGPKQLALQGQRREEEQEFQQLSQPLDGNKAKYKFKIFEGKN